MKSLCNVLEPYTHKREKHQNLSVLQTKRILHPKFGLFLIPNRE